MRVLTPSSNTVCYFELGLTASIDVCQALYTQHSHIHIIHISLTRICCQVATALNASESACTFAAPVAQRYKRNKYHHNMSIITTIIVFVAILDIAV